MPRAYLGLGSNLGNRSENLDQACRLLDESEGISVVRVSSYRETEPVGGPEQGKFLNAAAEVQTSLTPQELLGTCQAVEAEMGRRRTVRWGPRIIDIDLLLYDGQVIDSPTLTVPHPLMHRRSFVLEPLAEIAPGVAHPTTGKTISELCADLSRESGNESEANRQDQGGPQH